MRRSSPQAILLGLGLQHRTVDELSRELDLPTSQLLGLFNRTVRKCATFLGALLEKSLDAALPRPSPALLPLQPVVQSLGDELVRDRPGGEGERRTRQRMNYCFTISTFEAPKEFAHVTCDTMSF